MIKDKFTWYTWLPRQYVENEQTTLGDLQA